MIKLFNRKGTGASIAINPAFDIYRIFDTVRVSVWCLSPFLRR